MARYIDADLLWKALDMAHLFDEGNPRHIAQQVVEEQPTADVVKVKHGMWQPYFQDVEVYNSGGFKERKQTGYICSKCKSRKSFTPYSKEKYCSNCGAKMDGERKCEDG